MPEGLTGDTAKLETLEQRIGSIASVAFRRKVLGALAKDARGLVEEGFRSESDPDGRAWAPLKYRKGGRILRRTGRMAKRFRARVLAGAKGFEVTNDTPFISAHQFGAIVTTKTRINAHARSGRFLARARAEKRKRGAVRVSVSHAHSFRIPARPMVPGARLPARWATVFEKSASEVLGQWVGAK